jgi:hypothetical protein
MQSKYKALEHLLANNKDLNNHSFSSLFWSHPPPTCSHCNFPERPSGLATESVDLFEYVCLLEEQVSTFRKKVEDAKRDALLLCKKVMWKGQEAIHQQIQQMHKQKKLFSKRRTWR